jgi:hypothetical protein
LEDVRELLSRGDVPISGSLFQLMLGIVNRRSGAEAFRWYVLVDSMELRELHGVADIPKPFAFS